MSTVPGGPRRAPNFNLNNIKTHCKWIHDGSCAFQERGCKYKHEIPLDKESQHRVGLSGGLPQWIRRLPEGERRWFLLPQRKREDIIAQAKLDLGAAASEQEVLRYAIQDIFWGGAGQRTAGNHGQGQTQVQAQTQVHAQTQAQAQMQTAQQQGHMQLFQPETQQRSNIMCDIMCPSEPSHLPRAASTLAPSALEPRQAENITTGRGRILSGPLAGPRLGLFPSAVVPAKSPFGQPLGPAAGLFGTSIYITRGSMPVCFAADWSHSAHTGSTAGYPFFEDASTVPQRNRFGAIGTRPLASQQENQRWQSSLSLRPRTTGSVLASLSGMDIDAGSEGDPYFRF